jgi:hypothetical protein
MFHQNISHRHTYKMKSKKDYFTIYHLLFYHFTIQSLMFHQHVSRCHTHKMQDALKRFWALCSAANGLRKFFNLFSFKLKCNKTQLNDYSRYIRWRSLELNCSERTNVVRLHRDSLYIRFFSPPSPPTHTHVIVFVEKSIS